VNNVVTLKCVLEVTQDHSNWYHSTCGFLFAFYSNYGSILHHFGDKSDILVENRHFFIPPCIRRPRYEGSCWNSAMMFGTENLELLGYPTVKNFEDTFIRFHMIHERD